jgi:hypothetical protein
MSTNQNNTNFNLSELLANFRDLDYISKKLLFDIHAKNEILKNDLEKYKMCRNDINNISKSQHQRINNTQSDKKFY